MPYNGSGVFTPYTPGNPVTTGTTISSTVQNNTVTDFATGLSTALTKDGQTTATQRIPFAQGISNGSKTLTAVADGTQVTHAATVGQLQSGSVTTLGTVAGTNTITAVASPALAAYAAGKSFTFIPANTNTGATTIDINSVGARNIFWNGAACVGGELKQNVPVTIFDDGTQFNIVGNGFNPPFVDTDAIVEGSADRTKKVRIEADGITTATTRVITMPDKNVTLADATDSAGGLIELATLGEVQAGTDTTRAVTPSTMQSGKIVLSTPQASTSGTAILFGSIPSWVKRITMQFVGVSHNGTSDMIVQIGPSGGIETSGYLGSCSTIGASATTSNYTDGFGVTENTGATVTIHGTATLTLENASTNTWVCTVLNARSEAASINVGAGSKSLAGALTQLQLTTQGGANIFDAGAINIIYE